MDVFGVIKKTFTILLPPIVVFLLHLARMILLPLHFELDRVAHLVGGWAMAWAGARFYRHASIRSWIPNLSSVFLSFWLVATTALVGVLWEFWEFYFLNQIIPGFDMTLPDTIDDLTLDVIGAVMFACFIISRYVSRKKV